MAARSLAATLPRTLLDWVPRPVPGPAPSGADLVVRIRCSASRAVTAASHQHDVVIGPGWSVSTPHDLAAERLGVALGGYLSCLELVDRALPAARSWVALEARSELPELVFEGSSRRWRPRRQVAGCCEPEGYVEAGALGDHLRSPEHLTASHGADPRQVELRVAACRTAHRAAAELALPSEVAAHRSLGVPGPIPVRFYLGLVARRPNDGWLARSVESWSDVDDLTGERVMPSAAWLAWAAPSLGRLSVEVRSAWLATGMSRSMIVELDGAGYLPEDVLRMASRVNRSARWVAHALSAWVRAGCRPSVEDLLALDARGVPYFLAISAPALRRLREEAGDEAAGIDDTELALLLAAVGTVPQAMAALRAKATDWRRFSNGS